MSAADAMLPPRSVEEIRESLTVTEKGQTANTIGNCQTVFCQDPLLKGAICLNLLTDRVDIVRDLGWRRSTSALTDTDVKYLLLYFEQNYGLTSEKKLTAALSIVANENCYHPIQDALNALVWDGQPRIRSCLHHFLGAEVSDYVEEMFRHFLLGAVRRVFHPGSKYEEMLCLVGGQGAGKSTFFRLLAMKDEWFSDDLKRLDDDKVFAKLQGHWIIEMSEMLATSTAKSIEEIRSFISRQKETYRIPYETQPKDRLRQCVFGGTSNTLDFLPLDRAGNRRFLPIMVYPEVAEVHILENESASRAYLLQVWAEAMSIYKRGRYSMKFTKEIQKQLVEVQKDFMPEDTEAGQFVFLDTAWMDEITEERLHGTISEDVYANRIESVRRFERQLTDNGYLVMKFFLHISKKEQSRRIAQLEHQKDTTWRVSKKDLWQNEHYEKCMDVFSGYLKNTNMPSAPWSIIDAKSRKWTEVQILETLTQGIEIALSNHQMAVPLLQNVFPLKKMPLLCDIPLDKCMEEDVYKKELKQLQQRLGELHNRLYRKKVPVIIAYEGWDAAGKGGNIKRITGALDPRGYEVHPIASPEPHEKARHYLWRFWTRLPL